MKVLCLYESSLPKWFDEHTIAPGEARVIGAIPDVTEVHLLGRSGKAFYESPQQGEKTDIEKKIHVHHIPWSSAAFLYYFSGILIFFAGLQFLINHRNISVIHAESPHISGPATILLGKLFHIPVITEYRASYQQLFNFKFNKLLKPLLHLYKFVTSWVFANSAFILANSALYAEEIKQLGYPNIDWYNPGVRMPKKNPKKDNDSRYIYIGFLGRLYLDKGPQLFLASITQLSATTKNRIKILIGGDGPAKQELQDFVNQHQLNSKVLFLGTVDRWEFLNNIDILVNPNPAQPALDMVNAEAAVASVPVICFGDSQRPLTVLHKKTGLKVPHRDVTQLSKAIERLVNDTVLRQQLSRNAPRWAKSTFAFEKQATRVRKVYRKLHLC